MKVKVSFTAEISESLLLEGEDVALGVVEEHIETLVGGREWEEQQIFQSYEDLEIEPQGTEADLEEEYTE